ncbi:MAG: RecQ family ATP-dependent DNA helicase, partial [Myxococcota bacterium]
MTESHAIPDPSPPRADWSRVLEERFGFEGFRPWQEEAVASVLGEAGRALVIAPTGGGKSLCYQFPAVLLEGTTVVVSPLIALMEDQVRALTQRGIAATWLASTVEAEEREERRDRLARGDYDLVYIAPERLRGGPVLDILRRSELPLLAIDEAHCISQWGHDFRPDYRRLGRVIRELQPKRILACTATATPQVREDILKALDLGGETPVILRGFARPNLHLAAAEISSLRLREAAMLSALRDSLGDPRSPKGAAIVYAMTRKQTEQKAEPIARLGFRTAAYHAGMEPEARAAVNRRFADGELDVVVATNAFGMGIDRADIRAVIHFQPPGSIEA